MGNLRSSRKQSDDSLFELGSDRRTIQYCVSEEATHTLMISAKFAASWYVSHPRTPKTN
jgi:hypothetical protein